MTIMMMINETSEWPNTYQARAVNGQKAITAEKI
jgi:hypothetical protein